MAAKEANVVTPVSNIITASQFHTVSYNDVYISVNLDDKEIYKQGGFFQGETWLQTYALTNVGLSKLMNAAGIEETSNRRTDNHEHPHVCAWQFSAKWVQPDSTILPYSADYELDLRDYININGTALRGPRFEQAFVSERDSVLDKRFAKELKSAEGKDKAEKRDTLYRTLDDETRKDIDDTAEAKALRFVVQVRQFIVQRAQTGAMERVVRKMLNLKSAYTMEELKKPFRVPRSRFDWERLDKVVGADKARELREIKAMELMGITPEKFIAYKRLAAPQNVHPSHVDTPHIAPVSEETITYAARVEEAKPEVLSATREVAENVEILGKQKPANDRIGTAVANSDWFQKNVRAHKHFKHDNHFINYLSLHFGIKSAINMTFGNLRALMDDLDGKTPDLRYWKAGPKKDKPNEVGDPVAEKEIPAGLAPLVNKWRSEFPNADEVNRLVNEITTGVDEGIFSADTQEGLAEIDKAFREAYQA